MYIFIPILSGKSRNDDNSGSDDDDDHDHDHGTYEYYTTLNKVKHFLLTLWSAGAGNKCIEWEMVIHPVVWGWRAEKACRKGCITRCSLTLVLALLLLKSPFVASSCLNIPSGQSHTHIQPKSP